MKNMTDTKKKSTAVKTDDSVVYKVPIAFALLFIVLFALRKLGRFYQTMDGFGVIYPLSRIAMIVFGILALAAIAVRLFVKKPLAVTLSRYGIVLFLLGFVTSLLLRNYWVDQMTLIYFLHAFVYCLYMVELLYQWEFFFYSFATVLSGYLFFRLFKGHAFNFQTVFAVALTVVVLALIVWIVRSASKNKGILKLGKKQFRLFSSALKPEIFYALCGLWLVLIVLSLLCGVGCAYYCMFAAIAFELIGAVYYTFQLK